MPPEHSSFRRKLPTLASQPPPSLSAGNSPRLGRAPSHRGPIFGPELVHKGEERSPVTNCSLGARALSPGRSGGPFTRMRSLGPRAAPPSRTLCKYSALLLPIYRLRWPRPPWAGRVPPSGTRKPHRTHVWPQEGGAASPASPAIGRQGAPVPHPTDLDVASPKPAAPGGDQPPGAARPRPQATDGL